MNVLQALAITRNPSANYDSFVEAVVVLYANLFNGKVVYRCPCTNQEIYFPLTDDERDYLRCEMLANANGKDPDEEGLSDYFGD